MTCARTSMLRMDVLRSKWEMLLGEGWPWWSAQAARGEPARAKPAPAAVFKNSRRVRVGDFTADIRALVVLEFEPCAPLWHFMLHGSLATNSRSPSETKR